MTLEKNSGSRFKISEQVLTNDGKETWGLMKRFYFLDRNNLEDNEIDRIVIDSTLSGRPDKIADEVYGRIDLDWVILMFNNVENPFEYPNGWPSVSETVEYPTPIVVLAEV